MEWICNNLSDLDLISKSMLDNNSSSKKWVFFGDMGVGKTTLIKSLCKHLKVKDVVKSPTFSIVNEYISVDNEIVYHFDFYRLKNESEAYDLGYEAYFFSDYYCFVEWPSKIESISPDNFLKVEIINENGVRIINVLK
jgi:tRNA threonylcarbamoyladenosine biosynthesis protein TsaE